MSDIDSHVKRGHPIIFGLLTFFAFIEACITSFLVSKYNDHNNYPNNSFKTRLRFGVFTSWWTFVFSILYLVFFLTGTGGVVSSIASHGIWLFVTWIFWLALAASISAALGTNQSCGQRSLVYCHQNIAAEAFAWIEFLVITIAFISVVFLGTRSLRNGEKVSGRLGA